MLEKALEYEKCVINEFRKLDGVLTCKAVWGF